MAAPYAASRAAIASAAPGLPQAERILVSRWLERLDERCLTQSDARARDRHAELLRLQIEVQGALEGPFRASPPEGRLPALEMFQIDRLRAMRRRGARPRPSPSLAARPLLELSSLALRGSRGEAQVVEQARAGRGRAREGVREGAQRDAQGDRQRDAQHGTQQGVQPDAKPGLQPGEPGAPGDPRAPREPYPDPHPAPLPASRPGRTQVYPSTATSSPSPAAGSLDARMTSLLLREMASREGDFLPRRVSASVLAAEGRGEGRGAGRGSARGAPGSPGSPGSPGASRAPAGPASAARSRGAEISPLASPDASLLQSLLDDIDSLVVECARGPAPGSPPQAARQAGGRSRGDSLTPEDLADLEDSDLTPVVITTQPSASGRNFVVQEVDEEIRRSAVGSPSPSPDSGSPAHYVARKVPRRRAIFVPPEHSEIDVARGAAQRSRAAGSRDADSRAPRADPLLGYSSPGSDSLGASVSASGAPGSPEWEAVGVTGGPGEATEATEAAEADEAAVDAVAGAVADAVVGSGAEPGPGVEPEYALAPYPDVYPAGYPAVYPEPYSEPESDPAGPFGASQCLVIENQRMAITIPTLDALSRKRERTRGRPPEEPESPGDAWASGSSDSLGLPEPRQPSSPSPDPYAVLLQDGEAAARQELSSVVDGCWSGLGSRLSRSGAGAQPDAPPGPPSPSGPRNLAF